MRAIHIDPILYTAKPEGKGRLKKETDTYALLEKLDIPFRRLDHDATATIGDCLEVENILGIEICKNLFLSNRSRTEFYLLMMPGRKKFVTREVSRQIGCSRLSFAVAEDMVKHLNIEPGAVSVLGLMNDTDKKVTLLLDGDILKNEYFGCHPCVNTSSLCIRTSDLIDKFLPYTGHVPTLVTL